ncbi:MAG: HAMP domain-containing sensor histidine kinase [Actinomycetota bacterium]
MSRGSLRRQLVAFGAVAAVMPVIVLVLVVFGVEEDESIDATGDGPLEVTTESGVSPWIPVTAALLGLAALVVVWFWAKRAVDPIEQMTRLADEILAGSLDRRLGLVGAPDELDALAASFDRMLDRLAAASTLERRLLEDASHELRTPLAALVARLDVAVRRVGTPEVAEDLAACQADAARLQATLDDLLSSARARQSEVEQIDNDLVAIVARIVDRQRLVRPEAGIDVRAPEALVIGIDGPSVERAVANLVENALEHGASPVSIDVERVGGGAAVTVTDRGPGIEPERVPHVFERYAGSRHGLGLALVKQVADVYGEVVVESPVADGRGTRVRLRLDRLPSPGSD